MENYKVRVESVTESKEAQELFRQLGLKRNYWSGFEYPCFVANVLDGEFSDYTCRDSGLACFKELTLPELRDLVVLKRNDVDDATHEDMGHKYYTASNGNLYGFMNGKWLQFTGWKSPTFTLINKSETMKEYLNEKYELITAPESEAKEPHAKGWLEIPEGGEGYYQYRKGEDNNEFFLKKIGDTYYFANKESGYSWEWYAGELKGHEFVLWQRNAPTLPEELPFIDDEPHGHYKRSVSHLKIIDVYDILKLFNVTDPCLQHIVKKALCAGQRGHKDREEDLQDILDTAQRAVELNRW